MNRRVRWTVAVVAVVALVCCGGGITAWFSNQRERQAQQTLTDGTGCGSGDKLDPGGKLPTIADLAPAQMQNAAQIVRAGQDHNIAVRGWIVALATALQESGLRNLANDNVEYPLVEAHSLALPHDGVGHDHDSVGLFQQRPSPPEGEGGWGSVADLMTASVSAGKFYTALAKVPGWQRMSLTEAAQKVQRSAYPDAYAQWESRAGELVDGLATGAARAVFDAAYRKPQCGDGRLPAASGWIAPVIGPLTSPFGPRGGGFHAGADLGVPKGTQIRVASAGRVLVARCEAYLGGAPYSCNQDGGLFVSGCGWYVDVLHAGNIVTRYCHMEERPKVVVGQIVKVGDVIGLSGASGNASGPHLHFELHTGGGQHTDSATDPVPFMKQHGAPLGDTSP